jgi:pimeloyl-ACP methyl ester carboxylesterase
VIERRAGENPMTTTITQDTVAANGLRFDVRSAGPVGGPLVMLLHGFPQSGAMWETQLTTLAAAGHRAVAPDQRGYSPGARPRAVRDYRIQQLGADIVALAAALGRHRFHVVGHDWGGAVGWYLAAAHREAVASLTSVSTPHPRALASALRSAPQLLRSAYIPFFRLPWVPERVLSAANHLILRQALLRSGLPADGVDRTIDELARQRSLPSALAWYRANGAGMVAAVGTIHVPTLYVWSTGDTALGRVAANGSASHVEGPYRFEVLDGVSHWIPETAADALDPLLLDHLDAWRHDQHER